MDEEDENGVSTTDTADDLWHLNKEIRNKYESNIAHVMSELSVSRSDQSNLHKLNETLENKLKNSELCLSNLKKRVDDLKLDRDETKQNLIEMTKRYEKCAENIKIYERRLKEITFVENNKAAELRWKKEKLDNDILTLKKELKETKNEKDEFTERMKSTDVELFNCRNEMGQLSNGLMNLEEKIKSRVSQLLWSLCQSENNVERYVVLLFFSFTCFQMCRKMEDVQVVFFFYSADKLIYLKVF